jgi:hypothetical protein
MATRRFSRLAVQDAANPTRMKFTLDKLMTDLETAFTAVDGSIAALAAAAAAQTTANTAVTNAATAQTTANTVKRDDAISTSWTSPGTILSATDAGSNATITVANHTRKYSDNTTASVTGANLTALSYSTTYYVYYDQTSRAGGAVAYHAVTDPNTAQPNAAAGRHFCGKVITPAAAGAPTSGGYTPPGGYSGSGEIP